MRYCILMYSAESLAPKSILRPLVKLPMLVLGPMIFVDPLYEGISPTENDHMAITVGKSPHFSHIKMLHRFNPKPFSIASHSLAFKRRVVSIAKKQKRSRCDLLIQMLKALLATYTRSNLSDTKEGFDLLQGNDYTTGSSMYCMSSKGHMAIH